MVTNRITMIKRLIKSLLNIKFSNSSKISGIYTLAELIAIRDEIISEIKRNNELLQYTVDVQNTQDILDINSILDKLQKDLLTVKTSLLKLNVISDNNFLIMRLENSQKKLNNWQSYLKKLKHKVQDVNKRQDILKKIKYDKTVNKLKKEITEISTKLKVNNNKIKVTLNFVFNNYSFLQNT